MPKYYIDLKTISMLWNGAARMPQLDHLLRRRGKSNDQFYTSAINPAQLLDELERTSSPTKVEKADKDFRNLFVRKNAPIKLVSVHQHLSSLRRKWANNARESGYELSFDIAIELATAEDTHVNFYVTYIKDEKKLTEFADFVGSTTKQFTVTHPDAIIEDFMNDMYSDSTDDDPGSQPSPDDPGSQPSPNTGKNYANAAHNKEDMSGLFKPKRKPTE